jgi:regulator of extracellular matrix RemA (YlzA/DUF370 family)
MANSRLYNPQTSISPMTYYLIGAGVGVVVFIITIIVIVYWVSKKIKNETDDVYELVDKNKKETSKNIIVMDRKLTESSKVLNEKLDEKTKKHDDHSSVEKHLTTNDIQNKINPLEKKLNTLDTKHKVRENNLDAHIKSPHISKTYVDDQYKLLDDQFKTLDEQYKQLNTRVEGNSSSILQMNVEDTISDLRKEMTDHHNNDVKHLTSEQINNLKSLNEFEVRLAELEKTVDEISEEN